ncbi:unnamed protein product [Aphanomyces euteiches]
MQQIVSSMEAPGGFDVTYSVQLIGTLFALRILAALLTAHSEIQTQLVIVKVTSALQHLLFQKALRLDAATRQNKSLGDISNYCSADIRTIVNFSYVTNQLWILPVQIIFTLFLLYEVIGWSTFVGAGVIIITLLANQWVSMGIERNFGSLMGQRDLNAWEEKFAENLGVERKLEVKFLWNISVWFTLSGVLLYLGPALVTIASFPPLSYFTMLKYPFSTLTYVLATTLQAFVSMKRVMEFLNMNEKKSDVVWTPSTAPANKLKKYSEENIAIAIEDASIGWNADKPLFKNSNMTIKNGEFVVVHGSVGEGKSSLCAALLGEMAKLSGNIFVGGRVAYFSQQSWIQNLTVRENVLFGKPYDREKYNRVIEACALVKDLSLFAAGDRTEIGQKGINLSGGQKARVCLARACYSDADIFILDSPLSAVDAIVQNEIFTKCFLGLLRNKTILLVTHAPDIIGSEYIDRLIEIKNGQLIESVVASRKTTLEPLVKPLPARPARYVVEADDDVVVEEPPRYDATYNSGSLISPSISTPLHGSGNPLFTPVNKVSTDEFVEASGQLVLEEERSEGSVSGVVYKTFFEAGGGWCMALVLLLSLLLWQGLMISSDLWLNVWTNSVNKVSSKEFINQSTYYLSIYALLSLFAVVATILRSLTMYSGSLRASSSLFDQMSSALLRAPMRFFDQNPVGRILNRYTNDTSTMDVDIPFWGGFIISSTFLTVCTMATAIYMTQALGLFILPLVYLYITMGSFYVKPLRELERVNKITMSTLLNLISEAIEGVLVIRSFGDKQLRRFQRLHFRNVDISNESMFAKEITT